MCSVIHKLLQLLRSITENIVLSVPIFLGHAVLTDLHSEHDAAF